MKPILSIEDLIVHMKSKGIKFNIINEEEASTILKENSYFFHLSAYRILYPKNNSRSSKAGQYQNLEFAYLYELSLIDKKIRNEILKMCLEIESQIKVKLVNSITENAEEDGYTIVKTFLKKQDSNLNILKGINRHKAGKYCHDLIEKYYPFFPIWVLTELCTFGDLIRITQFYQDEYKDNIIPNNKFINTVRDLRNATAHNNCVINAIASNLETTKQPDARLNRFIKQLNVVSDESRSKNMHNRFEYDFVTLLYVYDKVVPLRDKIDKFEKLCNFIHEELSEHLNYFKSNSKLVGVYNFLIKIIDKLYKNYYSNYRIEK